MTAYRDLFIFSAAILSAGFLILIYFLRRPPAKTRISKIYVDAEEMDFISASLPPGLPPFIVEAVVPHLGKKIEFFLSAGNDRPVISAIRRILPTAKIKEEDDFSVFHPGGETIASFVEAGDSFRISRLDFSKINEVGESCLVQVLRDRGNKTEIRLLVSAPSRFQAEEIAGSVIPKSGNGKIVKTKNGAALIRKINSRQF